MKIYVDIDETICTRPKGTDYRSSVPLKENINKINKLYEEGNTIIYWTARGGNSGLDWSELTEKQLKEWGVKHHAVYCTKPSYDLFIDDKSIRIEEI